MLIAGFDSETTGFLDTGDHRFVEIYAGLWDLDTQVRVDEFYRKIQPGRNIPAEASRVHGIMLSDVAGCPAFEMIAEELMIFLRRGVAMVAHNGASFDGPFLDQELVRNGFAPHGMPIIDTMTGARWATANGKSPTLGELCFACNVPYDPAQAHGAAYDVEVMMQSYFTARSWGYFQELPSFEEIQRAA